MSESTKREPTQEELVEAAAANCPELRPAKALDARTRLASELAMARAASSMQNLQNATDGEDVVDAVGGLEGIIDVTDEVIEFLAVLAKRPSDLRRWASELSYELYVPVLLKVATDQMGLLGKSEDSDGS